MALDAFLYLTGSSLGAITGGVVAPGREGALRVHGFSHSITAPRDSASGLPTGKRQHKPLVITKDVDRASPLLYHVLTHNETLTNFTLNFWRPSRSGREEQYYSVELEDATISEIRSEMLNNRYAENAAHTEREHISFTYRRITWTHKPAGVTASEEWGI